MLEGLTNRFSQVQDGFTALSPSRKFMVLGIIAAVVAGFVVLMLWANRPDFQVIYSGLSPEDAGAIVAKLKERKVPFQLAANGTAVMVPKEVIEETRLYLATEGLPAGGAVGMELFNKVSLGATDFVQRLNYQRALQGELERTIKKIREVNQVRVHLNIPKESLFIEEAREPSASVMLKLHAGRTLTRSQLEGIVHLVASSVEGLKARNISVVDASGGLLYSMDEEADGALMTAKQIEYRRNLEKTMADRVTSMLERVVGPGKALARVTADLNFQQISTSEEIYDPDRSGVRSEQRSTEKSSGPGRGVSGVPTERYETGGRPREAAAAEGQQEIFEKSEETTNYEITRINRQTVTPGGEIKRLTVAVMVDGTYTEEVKEGKKVKTFVPIPENKKKDLADLVKSAVGYDETRGDIVEVRSVPFFTPEEFKVGLIERLADFLRQYSKLAFNVLLIVLFFLFIVRPVVAWIKRESEAGLLAPPPPEALPAAEEAEALPEPEVEKGRLTRDQVLTVARQNPERTVNLIRSWIDER